MASKRYAREADEMPEEWGATKDSEIVTAPPQPTSPVVAAEDDGWMRVTMTGAAKHGATYPCSFSFRAKPAPGGPELEIKGASLVTCR